MKGINIRVDDQPLVLVGRHKEVEWITRYLAGYSPKSVNVIGEPFIGLTSLLQHVYQAQVGAADDGKSVYVWLPMIELGRGDSLAFWRFLLTKFEQEMKQRRLSTPGEPAKSADPSELFYLLMEQISDLHQTKVIKRIIFVIDGFDSVMPTLAPDDMIKLRGLIEAHQGYFAVVLGSSQGIGSLQFEYFPELPGSFLSHKFEGPITLGLLSRSDATQLLRQEQENVFLRGNELSAEDVDFLLAEAGYHPGLLKITIQRFANTRWEQSDMAMTLYEATRLDLDTDDRVSSILRTLYDRKRRTIEEKKLLQILAEQGPMPIAPQRLTLIEGLRKRGLVQINDGQVGLFSQAFQRWLRTQAHVSQPVHEHKAPAPEGLTSVEERLLRYFEANAHRMIPADELLSNVWGDYRSIAVVEKGINRLRSKIEPDPKQPSLIRTVTGRGYIYRPNGSGKN